ncbi:rRNA-processing protein fcf2 [Termitomyces sp. J132]|nr:rRNA-processing protein fcf2 [Termitomyces sp. J132]
MLLSTTSSRKGKEKAVGMRIQTLYSHGLMSPEIPLDLQSSTSESSEPSDSSSSEHSDSDSDSDDSVTPEYLENLLEKARQNYAAAAATEKLSSFSATEEVIALDEDPGQKPLPMLDPGNVPPSYFELGISRFDGHLRMRDPGVESAEKASSSQAVPSPPVPPPELTKSGKPLTRKERKEIKNKTAGSDWFDLPAPAEADLPRLYRDVEALRLRNQLDPKRFYRKDEGEGKGIKGLPKYFAIGTILPSSMPFGTASGENLSRANRKRTLVDELVDDAEAKRYAKKKFEELQSVRGAKGKNTLAAKKAMRRPKW